MVSSVVNLCPFPHSLLLLYLTGLDLVSMTVDHAPHSGQFIWPPYRDVSRLLFWLGKSDGIGCSAKESPLQQ